ncbi:MAG TPA: hypothetical protein VGT98_13155, partial [Candidatus Elarobacter sp.]|nr:hypothetical protein [Candidatus Elarobacter sp.]
MKAIAVTSRFVTFVALATLSAVAVRAQTPGQKPPPSADSLHAIEQRGSRLARYDFVAWVATDSLLARGVKLEPGGLYVVRPVSDGTWEAVFGRLNAATGAFLIDYIVRQRHANPTQLDVEAFATPYPDTGFVLRAARAITAATRDFGPQQRPYNASILEQPDGGLFVYLMPAQLRQDVFPLGGDVRYHFSPDGRQLLAKRRLHNAILEFSASIAGGNTLQAGTHRAVLDDIPEDTDVFHVLVRKPRVPEYVVTDEFLYGISPDGHIRLV